MDGNDGPTGNAQCFCPCFLQPHNRYDPSWSLVPQSVIPVSPGLLNPSGAEME